MAICDLQVKSLGFMDILYIINIFWVSNIKVNANCRGIYIFLELIKYYYFSLLNHDSNSCHTNNQQAQLSMNPRPNITSYHVCMEDGRAIGQKLGCG